MKKLLSWGFFFLCVTIFLVFRFLGVSQSRVEVLPSAKPSLPEPKIVKKEHPWLSLQPDVQGAHMEIVRDLEKLYTFSSQIDPNILIQTLLALQSEIPFTFPDHLYNVLCITEEPLPTPAPFHVYKRLYLGETELGLPFYLDVRVFELANVSIEEIISWHLTILDGMPKKLLEEENHVSYLCFGNRNQDRPDTTHGFAALQGERGLFLDFIEKEGRLYVAYAEAPLSTFKKHLDLFEQVAKKN